MHDYIIARPGFESVKSHYIPYIKGTTHSQLANNIKYYFNSESIVL